MIQPLRAEQELESAVLQKILLSSFLLFSWNNGLELVCDQPQLPAQGQGDSLKWSHVTQLWNTPFSFTEHPKSHAKNKLSVLEFKKFSHVKSFNFLFLKLTGVWKGRWVAVVTVSALSAAAEADSYRTAPEGLLGVHRAHALHHALLHFCAFAHEPSLTETPPFCLPAVPGTLFNIRLPQAEWVACLLCDLTELSIHTTFIAAFYWPASHIRLWVATGRECFLIVLVSHGGRRPEISGYSANICQMNKGRKEWQGEQRPPSFVCIYS